MSGFFQNFRKNAPLGLSEVQYTRPGEQLEEKFRILKKMSFVLFSDIERKTFVHISNFFYRWNCQICILRVQMNILKEKKKYNYWNKVFCHFWDFGSNIFSLLSGVFATTLSEMHSKCPKEHLEWNDFFWVCQNCIIRVQANILRISFAFWKRYLFIILGQWQENSPPFLEVYST